MLYYYHCPFHINKQALLYMLHYDHCTMTTAPFILINNQHIPFDGELFVTNNNTQ